MGRTHHNSTLSVGQVFVEFTKKPVSAWAGLATIIGGLLERIEFRQWVEGALPVSETSNNSCGVYSKVLTHLLTVFCGGERFGHMQWWRHGVEVFERAFDIERFAKAPTSLTRFWNKFDSQAKCEAWGEQGRSFAAQVLGWAGVWHGNLNLDSTVLTRYGSQEGAHKGYNPKKKGRPSHHPLLAFVCAGYVVNLWNRSGDTASGQGCVEFFDQTLLALGEQFRVRHVLCDSGFYQIGFIEHLEKKGVSYILSVPITAPIQAQLVQVGSWRCIEEGLEAGEFYFEHADPKWRRPRRYIAIRQHVQTRPNATGKHGEQMSLFEDYEELGRYRYSVLLTNDHQLAPVDVWREYRPRANDENVLKDLKQGLGLGAFNVDSFWATEAILVTTALVCYNLLHFLDRQVLNRNRAGHQAKTIRRTWFILPGQLGNSGGSYRLRIAVKPGGIRAKLIRVLNEILRLPHRLNCIAVEPP